jgi:hypothetical protein
LPSAFDAFLHQRRLSAPSPTPPERARRIEDQIARCRDGKRLGVKRHGWRKMTISWKTSSKKRIFDGNCNIPQGTQERDPKGGGWKAL